MIDPSNALGLSAQVAVSLIGFTGVVAVFGPRAVHEWAEAERFRLILLLTASVTPLALSLFALLLLATDMAMPLVWQIGSGVALAGYLAIGIPTIRAFQRMGAQVQPSPGSALLFRTTSIIGLGVCLLQAANIVWLEAFWPFFTQIVSSMLIALLQFVRLIVIRPEPSG
jgi:hypothetical protein